MAGRCSLKQVIILDCGPSLPDVSRKFGQPAEWIMDILSNTDCSFTWVKSFEGETVETTDGDAWIISGSSCSVYDELEWMLDLEEKLRSVRLLNKPVLGICFGCQLIAKSYGGKVELNPEGWELGAYPMKLTKEGLKSRILSGFSDNAIVYQSHSDCVTRLPRDAVKLAQNKKGTQAFKIHNNIYGVQFHPEFSWDIIKKYVSVRSGIGVVVDDPSIPESNAGQVVLHNFIEIIL